LYPTYIVLVSSSDLKDLDAALVGLRRLWEHPAIKRRFQELLGRPVELSLVRTLRAIEQELDEPGVRHVAECLAVDRSTASRLVDQAVAAGCVTRETSARDRRACVLALTDQGIDLLSDVTAVRAKLLAELTDGWSADDVTTLTTLLTRLRPQHHE